MIRLLSFILALHTAALSAQAQSPLAHRAATSDVIVLARLDRTDYQTRRGIPVGGTAWVEVLLNYKSPHPVERLKIIEQGVGEDRCYFPEAPLWAEPARFLLFLQSGENNGFRGHPDGCMLAVLVTRDNRYAVRWPQHGLSIDPSHLHLIRDLDFHGPGAFVDPRGMSRRERSDLMVRYAMVETIDQRLRYTRGVLLEDFRVLLALKPDPEKKERAGR